MTNYKSEGEMIKRALADQWQLLHVDIQKRFQKNPNIGSPLSYQGTLDELTASFWGKLVARAARPFIGGALIPHSDYNFPVDIQVYCKQDCPHVFKHRIYKLNNRKPIEFISHMEQHDKDKRLREYVGCGFGMFLIAYVKEGNLHFKSDGYFWEIGKWRIPIPDLLSPGKTRLSHNNISENTFSIRIDIDHILFGKMFTQEGTFKEIA